MDRVRKPRWIYLNGSDVRVLTVLLNTQSWFPSSVKSLIPQPRTSLAVSADPLSGATVDILTRAGVFLPIPLRNFAEVMPEIS